MRTPPDPPVNPLVREADQLIHDIRAGKGLTSLTAGSAIAALTDMIKRVHAYEETHVLLDPDAVEDVLDDLVDLRDEIALSGLPPQPYHSFDFRMGTPPPPGAVGPSTGTTVVPPPMPPASGVPPPVVPGGTPSTTTPTGPSTATPPIGPTPATSSPVAPPPFLPETDAQRWLSDQQLAHDSPAYRAARDYWLSLVKDYATVATDAWPAARGKAGFAGGVAEDVQYRVEDIEKAVTAAFPDPTAAAVPIAPRAPAKTDASVPPAGGGARVKPLPQPPKRAPRRGLTIGRLTALLVLLLLLLAGGVVYLAGRGPAPAGSPGSSAGGALTPAPVSSGAVESVPVSAAAVITTNVLVDNVGSPCTAPTTLHMKWVLQGVPPGTSIVVDMSGPGLPAQASFVVGGDGSVAKDYPVPAGPAVWTTDLAEIGTAPAPSANAQNKSTVSCSGP